MPPKAEDLNLQFSEQAISELEALKTHYPNWKACILPALWIAQREYNGFLSDEAISEVAHTQAKCSRSTRRRHLLFDVQYPAPTRSP